MNGDGEALEPHPHFPGPSAQARIRTHRTSPLVSGATPGRTYWPRPDREPG